MKKLSKEKKALIAFVIFSLSLYICLDALYATVLLLILIATLIFAKIISLKTGPGLTLSVGGRGEFEKKDLIEVDIVIDNRSFFPLFRGEINLVAENILSGEKHSFEKSFSIGVNKKCGFPFMIEEKHCGCISLQVESFYIADPFLLFKKALDIGINKEIYVLPKLKDMNIGSRQIDSYDMESYKYSATRKGDDSSETFGIGEYLQGDSIKAIHWKLSSKLDELMIREYSHPIENKLMIILDKNIPDSLDFGPLEKDYATELFLSLSDKILKNGIDHTLAWHDYKSNIFQSMKIEREEDLWEAIRMVLKSPYRKNKVSTIKHYLASDLEKNFSKYIYIGKGRDDLEMLKEYGEVYVY